MRTRGPADELEDRRRLAVERVSEGYSTQEVADFLGVDPSTVRRWCALANHGCCSSTVSLTFAD